MSGCAFCHDPVDDGERAHADCVQLVAEADEAGCGPEMRAWLAQWGRLEPNSSTPQNPTPAP